MDQELLIGNVALTGAVLVSQIAHHVTTGRKLDRIVAGQTRWEQLLAAISALLDAKQAPRPEGP